jgi:hypothetical protein
MLQNKKTVRMNLIEKIIVYFVNVVCWIACIGVIYWLIFEGGISQLINLDSPNTLINILGILAVLFMTFSAMRVLEMTRGPPERAPPPGPAET